MTKNVLLKPIMGEGASLDRRCVILLAAIGLLFAFKAGIFALFITPLWDIPDEPGHIAYVEYIAHGKYPVVGEAVIPPKIMASWGGSPATNWIAQHPPLYYIMDAPFLRMAEGLGLNTEQQFRSTRLFSSICGGLTVFVAGLLGFRITCNRIGAFTCALLMAGTPMFLHMSSGTTHDPLLALLCFLSIYSLLKYFTTNKLKDAAYSGAFLGLASITKVTALALAIPVYGVLIIYLYTLSMDIRSFLARSGLLWIAFFTLPAAMMALNYHLCGAIFPSGANISLGGAKHVDIGYFEYILDYPIWQNLINNYFGLIGWTGTGGGNVLLLQIRGTYLQYFLIGTLIACLAALMASVREIFTAKAARPKISMILLSSVFICLIVLHRDVSIQLTYLAVILFVTVVLAGIAGYRMSRSSEPDGWPLITASVAILFFTIAYYTEIHSLFIGHMRAIHGRYFYPVLPLFFIIIVRIFSRRNPALCAFGFSIGSIVVSDMFFLHRVLRFYGLL